MDLIIPTVCFILYTPNVLFAPFVKNKWYNLIISSLLFSVTLYILQNLIKFKEGIKSGGFEGTTKECDDSKIYAKTVFKEVNKLQNKKPKMSPPPTTLDKNDQKTINDYSLTYGKNLTESINSVTKDVEMYSKQVCIGSAKWTPPPKEYIENPENYSKNLGLKAMEKVTIPPNILSLYNKTPTPTTARPTTAKPTTAKPTTARPTTAKPTTARPTTARPTTAKPTTATIAPQNPTIKK